MCRCYPTLGPDLDVDEETVTVRGIEMPVATADQIYHEHKYCDVQLTDLLNDYIMLNPSVSLSVQDQS